MQLGVFPTTVYIGGHLIWMTEQEVHGRYATLRYVFMCILFNGSVCDTEYMAEND
jgi:hypothetical protein